MNPKYYFFNIDFGQKLTGIERSSFKRAVLFSEYLNKSVIFVTANLNLSLKKNWQHYKEIGWVPKTSKLLNVYDDIMQLDLGAGLDVGRVNTDDYDEEPISDTHVRYYKKDRKFNMYIVWSNSKKEKYDYINYFSNGKKIRRDKFNVYGQLAVTQYLGGKGEVVFEDLFNPMGVRCITRNYDLNSKISSIYLYNENGIMCNVFSNEQDFLNYWCQGRIDDNSICIVDKNRVWIKPLSILRAKKDFKLLSVIHNVHLLAPYDDIFSDKLNVNYSQILRGDVYVDGCVILTPQQSEDIRKKFKPKFKILNIPHANDNQILKVKFNNRNVNKIISLARLDGQKQVDHMIEIMKMVSLINNDLQLFVYGEGKLRASLEALIEKNNLSDNVFLPGYTENISKELNESVLFISTSKTEGFPLAFMESMSHGVPIVSYDIKYGPKAIIENNKNGFIVEKNNIIDFKDKILEILNNKKRLEVLSNESYETAEKFNMENISKLWENELMEL